MTTTIFALIILIKDPSGFALDTLTNFDSLERCEEAAQDVRESFNYGTGSVQTKCVAVYDIPAPPWENPQ
jgi:hypothetical protein